MESIIKQLQTVVSAFTERINVIREATDTMKKENINKKYIPEETERLNAIEEERFNTLSGKERESAKKKISDIIDKARSYIANTVADVDTMEINKLGAMFEAAEGNPSKYALQIIIDSLTGSYWGLLYIWQRMSGNANAAEVLNPILQKPDPEYYLDLFDEIEAACINFCNAYKGPAALTDTTPETATALLFLSNSPWLGWSERTNVNSAYLTENTLTSEALTGAERTWLETMMGAAGRSTESAKRGRVIEMLEKFPNTRRILIRSQYAPFVVAYEEEKANEEALQIAINTPLEKVYQK